jgi:hypothetical protein
MALIFIAEDGTGRADANSYASVEEGDAYHDGHLYATAWTSATPERKAAALVMATRVIDAAYEFHGNRATEQQALAWPRVGFPDPERSDAEIQGDRVPRPVAKATCEMARELLIADRTSAPTGEGILRQRTGEFADVTYSKLDRRPVISHLAQALLAPYGYLISERSGMARLVRV